MLNQGIKAYWGTTIPLDQNAYSLVQKMVNINFENRNQYYLLRMQKMVKDTWFIQSKAFLFSWRDFKFFWFVIKIVIVFHILSWKLIYVYFSISV